MVAWLATDYMSPPFFPHPRKLPPSTMRTHVPIPTYARARAHTHTHTHKYNNAHTCWLKLVMERKAASGIRRVLGSYVGSPVGVTERLCVCVCVRVRVQFTSQVMGLKAHRH